MKRQCDKKRDLYDYMVTRYREGDRSKGGKGETFLLHQLQTAHDEYDKDTTFGLEEEDGDEGDYRDNGGYDENDDGELRKLRQPYKEFFSLKVRAGSQSAPLFADNKPDTSEKRRQMHPSLSRKFSSYVLPTPVHEFPRPLTSFPSNSRLLGLVGHSSPLVSRGQKVSTANNLVASSAASPLPMPPQPMALSFSIPSSGTRVAALHMPRTLESSLDFTLNCLKSSNRLEDK
ncbi:hypothetical protein JHK85_034521 [Glycine max]|nr:hypothetical protein JHK85_034521 [Glycine max]